MMSGGDPAELYQLGTRIGKGSFGDVFQGEVKATGAQVAIKVIDLEDAADEIDDIAGEIGVLAQCGSPHVTKFYGAFVKGAALWIVMEYLAGGSVADLMKAGPLEERQIAAICRELLLALSYLHNEGKIHRDIKAANVLLSGAGDVKLADFGVSIQLNEQLTKRHSIVGTPFWMAPEVIKQQGYDCKADVWSLGITAIEMAQGEPPWSEHHPMRVLFLIPKNPPPKATREGLSRAFHDFLATALQKQASLRPHARELLKHKFCVQSPPTTVLVPLIDRWRNWKAAGGDGEDSASDEQRNKRGSARSPVTASGDDEGWDFTGDEETAKLAEIAPAKRNITKAAVATTPTASGKVQRRASSNAGAAKSPAPPLPPSSAPTSPAVASLVASASASGTESPRKSAVKRAALHQVVYPVLSTLVKKNSDQPDVVRALAELKVAFDHLEAAQAGSTHALIAQLVSVLSK